MMKTTKANDAAKRWFDKQNRTNALLGIAGRVSLALGMILFSFGLWTHFHSAGGPLTASYKDDTVYVKASYGKEAQIPGKAKLLAYLVKPEEDQDAYSQKMAASMSALGMDGEALPGNAIYHIGFYIEDQEFEPSAPVQVSLQALQDGFAAGESVKVIHLGENDAKVIADTTADEAGCISFTTDEFSDFTIITQQGTEVMEISTVPVSDWNAIKTAAGTADEGSIYQLTTNIKASSICRVSGNLTIDLNGHTITSESIYSTSKFNEDDLLQGYVMFVDGSLTIMDSSTGNGTFTVRANDDPFGLVYVMTGGTLTLNGGTFENSKGFHAFRVSGGTLIINGGTIQNSGIENTDQGGGISVASGGSLTINGGTITGNKALTGAGIQFEGSGNFTMNGGTITGNTAGNNGGGLYFSGCTGAITFTGGTISNNKTGSGSHGGGMWFSGCPNITIGGTTEITGNTACAGGGIRLQDGCKLTMTGGTISNNTATFIGTSTGASGIGGGIAVTKSTVIINDGVISNNKATDGGGGIALRQGEASNKTEVIMKGGVISGNEVTGSEWRYGGGVYLQDHSTFTMIGGEISGNHGKGQGGGIATDYSGFDGKCTGDMKVTINGGTISGNYSELHEGGGIGMGSGTLEIEAKPGPVYITGNESRTTEHWGGGGIMISDKSKAVIINALIEGNTAGGFGGGLGACSTGHVYYGVGEDADNPSPLAAIFGNTAQGTNLSGGASKKDADHKAYSNKVFMESGYQDVYSALEAVISGLMLGGGNEAWTGSADGAPVAVDQNGFVSASQMLGLTSNATATDRENAREAASVFITGNRSNTHGGGIMCNGSLAMGWNAEMDITPGLAIKGTKQYEVKGEKATSVPEFQFAISTEEPTWVPETEGTDGHWQTRAGSSVFTTTNSVDGNFAFDLTFGETPGLKKETGTQTFYFWEVNEGGNGMTYDPALYKVTVTISEKTSTNTVAGATLSINTWSIDSDSAKVEKRASEIESYTTVDFTQKTETNDNSSEAMHWTTRTVITLTGTAFNNNYNGEAKISLKKVDEDGNPVEGAEFVLYRKDDRGKGVEDWDEKWTEITPKYTSNENGIIYADSEDADKNLPVGTYRLVETEAPEGYKLLSGYIEFEIKGTEASRMISCPFNAQFSAYVKVTDNGLTLQITNTLAFRPLQIVKYGADGTNEAQLLAGAEFELYVQDTSTGNEKTLLGTLQSGNDGTLAFIEKEKAAEANCRIESNDKLQGLLIDQVYYLKETKAPDGYSKLPEVEFKVTKDGIESIKLIQAPDDTTSEGASSESTSSEGTASEGTMTDGTAVDTWDGSTLILKLTDPERTVRVAFLKYANPSHTPLAGAEFKLYGSDYLDGMDKVNDSAEELWIGTSTVDVDGNSAWEGGFDKFPVLKCGESYYLVETKAPTGYNLPDGFIRITVDRDGKVDVWSYETGSFLDVNPVTNESVGIPGWFIDEDGTLLYDYVFTVPNESGYQLPETGGSGTLFYLLTGLMLTLGGAITLFIKRRLTRIC